MNTVHDEDATAEGLSGSRGLLANTLPTPAGTFALGAAVLADVACQLLREHAE